MKGTNIDGDVAIGRNLALGGNVVAQGMAHIKSGLRVDGWLDAENIKAANKGLFQNESELKKEYPKPLAGWFAVVIDDIDQGTGFIYTTVDGTWKKTQEQAKLYEFIMDSANVFATKNEFEQEQKRVQEIDDELLKRIQGVSDKSNSAKDPFKFLGTFTRVTGGEFLNALNAMHGTVAGVYDGYWRALIGASPVEIYNFAIYYNDDRWIQVLKSPYKWGDGDFDITNDTRYRTIYRIHENGAWGEWKDTEEELKKSISDETTRAKDAEQKLKDEIDNHLSKNVAWNDSSRLNDFTTAGVYEITGERKMSSEYDNLPIENRGSGHTISARLEVLDSSINDTTNSDDKCITQKLTLSNRVGGDGNVYIRTGRGKTYDSITWEKWGTLQTNINVGQVGSLDEFVDNGIYSGVWTDGSSFAQTFVMVVINDYAVAGANKTIVQYKYAYDTLKGNGEPTYNTRSLHNGVWSNWEDTHDDDLGVLKEELLNAININKENIANNSIAIGNEEYRATKAEKTLQKNIDNTNKIVGIEEKKKLSVYIGVVLKDGSTYSTNNSAYTNAFEGGDIAVTNDGYYIYEVRKVSADGVAEMVLVKSKRLRTEKGYTYQLNISKDYNAQFSENELEGIVGLYNYEGGDTSELEQKIEDAIRPIDENLNKVNSYVKGLAEKVKPSVNANTLEFEFDDKEVHLTFSDIDENNEESYDILLPTATTMGAGVMSAEDKKVLENLFEEAVKFDSFEVEELGDGIGINFDTIDGKSGSSIEIPFATEEKAGVMSAEDKKVLENLFEEAVKLDGFEVEELGDGIGINYDGFSGNGGSIEIPFATEKNAGVMSADDKKALDNVPENIAKEKTAIVNGDTIAGLAREVYSRTGKVDTATFLKRTTAGGTTISDGVASIKEIGGNIVKNLVDGTDITNWSSNQNIAIANNILCSSSDVVTNNQLHYQVPKLKGHVYYASCYILCAETSRLFISYSSGYEYTNLTNTGKWMHASIRGVPNDKYLDKNNGFMIRAFDSTKLLVAKPIVIDLTEMFGETKAKQMTKEECDRLFGTMDALPQGLTIAKPTGLKSIGYNQWNPVNVLRNKSIVENAIEDDVENSHIAVVECLPCKIGEGENNGYVIGYGEGELWDEDGIEVYFSPLNPMDYIDQDVDLYMHKLEQDATYGTYVPQCKGYLLVVTPTTDKLCVNFHWSGDRSKLDYEEYTESDVALPEIPQMSEWGLAGIQTYGTLACDTIDLDRMVYTKRIYKKVFNGSESWVQSGIKFYSVGIKPASINRSQLVNCIGYRIDIYVNTPGTFFLNKEGKSSTLYICPLENVGATDVATWKAYLANNPLEIYYELAEPEEYPIVTKTAPNYIGSDYGVEEFTGSKVPLNANILFYMRSLVGETRNFLDRLYDNIDKTDAKEVADYITNGIEGNKELATNAPNLALRALFIAAGAEYNDTDNHIVKNTPWNAYVDSVDYKAQWNLDVVTGSVQTLTYNGNTYEYVDDNGTWKVVARVGDKLIWDDTKVIHRKGYYYLNGLGDITESQMMDIYIRTFIYSHSHWLGNFLRGNYSTRTNYRPNAEFNGNSNTTTDITYALYGNKKCEVFVVNHKMETNANIIGVFHQSDIKHVVGVLKPLDNYTNFLSTNTKLTTIKIKGYKNNITITSPYISKGSVLYIIQNASTTSAITITLHADAFARLKDDADIVAALAAQPLITLASA